MVGKPSRRSGSGLGTLPQVRKWSVDPPGGQEVLDGSSWRSGDPPEGLEVVGGPSRRSGIGRGTLPVVRKWSEDPPRGQ